MAVHLVASVLQLTRPVFGSAMSDSSGVWVEFFSFWGHKLNQVNLTLWFGCGVSITPQSALENYVCMNYF